MSRVPRIAVGGLVYHVLNRANGRIKIFETEGDYQAFIQTLSDTLAVMPMRLLSYCIMPNHWHLVLWPRENNELGPFMQRLTVTHVRRWHGYRETGGHGHLYQGSYKSFPVENDEHALVLLRYVERNPLRAGLVSRAEDWRWSSLALRSVGTLEDQAILSKWPFEIPRDWAKRVNQPQNQAELDVINRSIKRGDPFGDQAWQARIAKKLGITWPPPGRGRPRKQIGLSPIS